MSFAAPAFLMLLAPFAGVVVYLLMRRRPRADVSFVDLWRIESEPRRRIRGFAPPPLPIMLGLGAILCGVLAAADPSMSAPWTKSSESVTVIVDRSLTMSAGPRGQERYRKLAKDVAKVIEESFGRNVGVRLLSVPQGVAQDTSGGDWWQMDGHPPTAMDTQGSLPSAIGPELNASHGAVIVLTDQNLGMVDERLIVAGPAESLSNVSIVRLALRERPRGQLMVRIRNQADRQNAELRIFGGEQEIARLDVALPKRAYSDHFINLAESGDVIHARLEVVDEVAADNHAYLVRARSNPIIEARTALPEELRRLIEQFAGLNPTGENSLRVPIVAAEGELGRDVPGIFFAAPADSSATAAGTAATVRLAAHPITRALGDTSGFAGVRVVPAPAGEGWDPVISINGQAVVTAKSEPARQVWVGMHSEELARTSEFVILWSNIFDYVGEGRSIYAATMPAALSGQWKAELAVDAPAGVNAGHWPGIYRGPGGQLVAVNAPDIKITAPKPGDWEGKIRALASSRPQLAGRQGLAGPLLICAMMMLVLAMAFWTRAGGGTRS